MRVLGIMSGTSIDSVDYVICRFGPKKQIIFEEHWQVGFPRKLKDSLMQTASDKATSHQVGQLHHDLGRFYAFGARRAKNVELIGLHGQTIFHQPRQLDPATFQIGESVYLAEALRVPVVSNFRAADLAMGGQGAPLATKFHQEVFAQKGRHIVVNNLGGISNVTSLDWRSPKKPTVAAFDTGPANVLIDLAISEFSSGRQTFDRDGKMAAHGTISDVLLRKCLRHPFIRKSPPKSTGRELFGEAFLHEAMADAKRLRLSGRDIIATLTEFTALSIAENYRRHLGPMPDEVILCGGGARNPYLFARIAVALRQIKTDIRISSSADHGWDSQVIEAAAFAFLAWLFWNEQPGNISTTTGASKDCILGQLTYPP